MDLLQELSKLVRRETDQLWGKLADVLYDATLGLVKQYQQKAVELVRISVVSFYLHVLRVTRRHLLFFFLLVFGTVLSAVAAVVVPVSIVLVMPWSPGIKALCLLILGSFYIAVTAWAFLMLFSQDRWMKVSGIQDLLDDISDSSTKFNGL